MAAGEDRKHFRGNTPDATFWLEILKPLARQMRHAPTYAEKILWAQVRNRRCGGAKFRRQHGIERFIVDFACVEHDLVIEVDGPIHDYTPEHDALRQAYIESEGWHVLRFANDDVLSNRSMVMSRITQALGAATLP
jgi:very-short-patch-repair endonuclease